MASRYEFGSIGHLAGRFFGALLPFGPPAADERWVEGHLLPGEWSLWTRMSGADRRHAVGVARRTVSELGGDTEPTVVRREVVAAALLHDVGKIDSGFGTWARAGVTFAGMAVGREELVVWSEQGDRRWRRRVGSYLRHDQIGADLLLQAGSDQFTVAWAGDHHRPPEQWRVEARLGEALKVADDD
jgi:HD domain